MLLAFTDLETNHREPDKGSILEVGMVITDTALNVLGFYQQNVYPLFRDQRWNPETQKFDFTFEDDDVLKMHTKNGLIAEIETEYEAGTARRRYEAEIDAVAWLESFGPQQLRIVGNSVWFDLVWIRKHMPLLGARFHRQIIDITSLNKTAEIFAPSLFAGRPKDGPGKHRALNDCKDSLRTLTYYRDNGLFHAPAVQLTRSLSTEDYARLEYEFRQGAHYDDKLGR